MMANELEPMDYGFPDTMATTPAELAEDHQQERSSVEMMGWLIVGITVLIAVVALGVHFWARFA